MENFENNISNENSFFNEQEMMFYLMETSKWANFLAILGFIGIGLMIIIGIVIMFGVSIFSKLSAASIPMGFMGFIYIIIAAIYFFPVNYLYTFSKEIKLGIMAKDTFTITSGFKNLKSLFKFIGIFAIIVMSIYALALVVMIPVMLIMHR